MRLTLFAVFLASAAWAQQPCEQLKSLTLPNTRITAATSVPTGAFTLPGQTAPTQVKAFCRVEGVVWPEVNFEVWLPAEWNGKFLGLGNGGLAGTISYAGMPGSISGGYAVASTDTGHKASDANWAVGHMERVIDFGYRGIHVMTQAAKAITAAHYGRAPEHSYFDGCSNGGRQALMEAQRFPEDYDGIVAGDPAHDWTHLYTGGHVWALKAMEGDAYIPQAKVPLLAEAVNKACDELDGIKDGILNDPRRCHFDPAILACKGADAPTCFTQAQIDEAAEIVTAHGEPFNREGWEYILNTHGGIECPVLIQPSSKGEFCSISLFGIFQIISREVKTAHPEAPGAVKEERFTKTDTVPLELVARNCLRSELLASTSESPTADQVVEAGGQAGNVKVTLIEYDAAIESGV